MKRVLLVGFDPATVDFSDPALPPGMTAEKIHAGVKLALADFAGRGWHAQNCFIRPDETAIPTIERFLAGDVYDCVVIGAGVRLPRNGLGLGPLGRFVFVTELPTRGFTVEPPANFHSVAVHPAIPSAALAPQCLQIGDPSLSQALARK